MSSEQSGSSVLDTGVLLELAFDSPIVEELRNSILSGQIQPVTGELNVTELEYLLCRRLGKDRAERVIEYLRSASQFRILQSSSFLDKAAEMKCARSLPLVDCVTLAMGESLGSPVLFARRERELEIEMKKATFKAKILFME